MDEQNGSSAMTQKWDLRITDDSGYMGVIDPDKYCGFVSKNWQLDQLFQHFAVQMAEKHLLLWATGRENYWNVQLTLDGPRSTTGFREIKGVIKASQGRLCLINYESLTMAAQFVDLKLPQKHMANKCIELPAGEYECRIVQLKDPKDYDETEGAPQFVIDFTRATEARPGWASVMWDER